MKIKTPSYQRHRFPSEIISHAVWLYHRFCLSFREGIVKLSEFEQKLGNTRIHNPLIVQHSGYWPEVENLPNLT